MIEEKMQIIKQSKSRRQSKAKSKSKSKSNNNNNNNNKIDLDKDKIMWCHCGHLITDHTVDGCIGINEGTECEDHWRCSCDDAVPYHIVAYRKIQMEKKKQCLLNVNLNLNLNNIRC